jgi:hypothetical protein
MAPSYVPLPTPRPGPSPMSMATPTPLPMLPGSTPRPQPQISYLDFLAAHNRQSPLEIGPQGVNPKDVMTSAIKDYGMDYLKDYLPSTGSFAMPSASTGGMSMANGAMMSGGQELGGMSLMNGGTAGFDAAGNTIISSAPEAGMFDLAGIGGANNAILPLAGAALGYDLFKSNRGARSRKKGFGQGAAAGAMIGSYFGLPGTIIGGAAGGIYGATQHESTRDVAKRRTQGLLEASDDPTYQAYVRGMREQYNSAPKDPSKPFAGKYKNFEEYKKAGLEAADLTGVEGNIRVYGPEWAKATEEQRKAVTQKNIDKGIYDSHKGDVVIRNDDLAKQSWDEVMKNPGANTASIMIPKRSPGFDKNGKRINYAR